MVTSINLVAPRDRSIFFLVDRMQSNAPTGERNDHCSAKRTAVARCILELCLCVVRSSARRAGVRLSQTLGMDGHGLLSVVPCPDSWVSFSRSTRQIQSYRPSCMSSCASQGSSVNARRSDAVQVQPPRLRLENILIFRRKNTPRVRDGLEEGIGGGDCVGLPSVSVSRQRFPIRDAPRLFSSTSSRPQLLLAHRHRFAGHYDSFVSKEKTL